MGMKLNTMTAGIIAFALSCSGHAACGLGNNQCEPPSVVTRAKVEQLLNSALSSPYSIMSLETVDGHSGDALGRKTYEVRFSAVINYSGDELRCRTTLCRELQNYSVTVDKTAKRATISGWLFLEETRQGWR